MTGKQLTPAENDAIRALVQQIVDDKFNGVIARAAKELGVSGPFVSEFLGGSRGAGMGFLRGLQRYTGRSLDDLLGARSVAAAPAEGTGAGRVTGWAEAVKACAAANPWTQPWMFERAVRVSGVDAPNPMTPEWVLEAVKFVLAAMSLREKADAARAQTEREIKKHVRDSARRVGQSKASKTGQLALDGAPAPKQLPAPTEPKRGRQKKR